MSVITLAVIDRLLEEYETILESVDFHAGIFLDSKNAYNTLLPTQVSVAYSTGEISGSNAEVRKRSEEAFIMRDASLEIARQRMAADEGAYKEIIIKRTVMEKRLSLYRAFMLAESKSGYDD